MVLAPPRRGFGVAARAVGHADGLSSACRSQAYCLPRSLASACTRISRRARRSGRTAPPSSLHSGGVGGGLRESPGRRRTGFVLYVRARRRCIRRNQPRVKGDPLVESC